MTTTVAPSDLSLALDAYGNVLLAGLPMFVGTDEALLDALGDLVRKKKPALVVTANVDQALDLTRSDDLVVAYKNASLRTLDGMPLIWLARVAGGKGICRQTGADMLTKCVSASQDRGWRIVILGGASGANRLAVERLCLEFPNATVQGVDVPYTEGLSVEVLTPMLVSLSRLRPDIVFVCLGSPKQERFFLELQDFLPPAVYIGAGAAVDFASGLKVRAPVFAQRLGLEWIWRLCQEPRRLAHRYLVKGASVGLILYNTLRKRKS